jgi:hypothetical protein
MAMAHAYFEETTVGARAIAMGFGSMASVDDASAHYWNPAALVRVKRLEGSVDYAKPHGLSEVDAGALAVALPLRGLHTAAAWHHVGISGVYSEDLFTLSAARTVRRTASGHEVSVGGSLRHGRVGFEAFAPIDPLTGTATAAVDYGSRSALSADAGVLWKTPWRVDLAWVGRDLVEPRYEFIAGSGGQLLPAKQQVGASIRWNRESTIALGWAQTGSGRTSVSAGIEVTFFDVFAIRSSLSNLSRIVDALGSPNDLQYNGGFGVYHKGWFVDAAATTTHDLGASYRITLRAPLPGGPR